MHERLISTVLPRANAQMVLSSTVTYMTKMNKLLINTVLEKTINNYYYSTMMSFYHIWSRERAKYETVIHSSVPV